MGKTFVLEELREAYASVPYPEEFRESYVIMECLAERNGVDTFLVQDAAGGQYVAKCYSKSLWDVTDNRDILEGLEHPGLPAFRSGYENAEMAVHLREYVEGTPLDLLAETEELTEERIVELCLGLCDVLEYLHGRGIIHRDIKPQNIIVREDGSLCLIDFDIARVYHSGSDTDTTFFGTMAYAPPEQYGFSQTDGRTDIYAVGVLMRYLLTGSTRENSKVRVYRPLDRIIRKCTGFSPKDRFSDVGQLRKALLAANPRAQRMRFLKIATCAVLVLAILGFGGYKAYKAVTYSPFNGDAIPAYQTDEERVANAVDYMKEKYQTSLFDEKEAVASVGLLRKVLIDLYGLDRDYVYGINQDMPQENDAYFLPWGYDDGQLVDRDTAIYTAVKVHDPSIVADWSSLSDDTGEYPGTRVALAFSEKAGLAQDLNRPKDITVGDLAVIFAEADQVFEAAEKNQ